jgi:CHAT domain-containing protein/tetratricopeptide (TPR) repeat protein
MREIRSRDRCRWSCALVGGRRASFVASVAGLLLVAGTSVSAQEQSAVDSAQLIDARARDAFRAGTRDGFEQAIRLWHQAMEQNRKRSRPTREAVLLNNIGLAHRALGRRDSAFAYHAQALPITRAAGDREGEAMTLHNFALVYTDLGRRDSALAYYARALPLRRAIGDSAGEAMTLHNMGLAHGDLGRPDSALAYLAQALPIRRAVGDRPGEARTLNSIGVAHWNMGRPDSALAYYAQALQVRRALADQRGEAMALNNIGLVHGDLGRPDSALAYYAQALSIQRALGDRSGEAMALHNIGLVYAELGRSDSALAYYAQALPITRALGDRGGEAMTLQNIGVVHGELGRHDSALAYFVRALPVRHAVGDRIGEATTLNNIGHVHAVFGRPDSALAYYAQALPITRAASDRAGEARTLDNVGRVHRGLGRSDSALAYFAQALPIRRAVRDRAGEARTLGNIARAHQHGSLPTPRVAVAYYDSAAAVLASIAERAGGDQNRLSFAEQQVDLFADWTLASLALAGDIGPAASARASLAAAERGRAQALLDLMRRSASGARGTVGSSAATIAVGADLAQEGARLAESVRRSRSTALIYMLAGDTLLTWLIDSMGDVSVFRAKVTAEELANEVAALRADLGADGAAVRSRLATRAAADLDPVKRGNGGPRAGGSRDSPASRLSAWLIPPTLLQKLRAAGDLVVVPHGPLNLLPFAALPVNAAGEPLGIRYSLRYAPSLATLAALGDSSGRAEVPARGAALVVGNPLMPRVRNQEGEEITLGQLAGAETEARWVADRVGATMLRGGGATEAEIKRLLPSASLVHLATHGYAYSSEARARASFVALAPSPGEDGLLTVGEVLDAIPSLRADLVVLSACQTGLGDLKQAEGTIGMQRAFLAKGARSVLVSLWSVSDEATEQLMRSFYTHWRNGASKADALRRAQMDVRGAPGSDFHDPRYWAAFILVGASR